MGGYLGTLDVLKARLRCSVRAPGSTVMLLGFTVQRCRKLGFIDPATCSQYSLAFLQHSLFSDMLIRGLL